MTPPDVEKYARPVRILHWVHSSAFIILFLTGLVLFVPPMAILAEGSWTRLIHRIAALVFIVAPLIYIPMNWEATWKGVKEAFTRKMDDDLNVESAFDKLYEFIEHIKLETLKPKTASGLTKGLKEVDEVLRVLF